MDPIFVSRELRDQYLSYLTTTFGPAENNHFSEVFARLLSRDGQLVNGPFLQATPPFQPAAVSLEDLVKAGTLCDDFRLLFQPRQTGAAVDDDASMAPGLFGDLLGQVTKPSRVPSSPRIPPTRPLYQHQHTAISRLCQSDIPVPSDQNTVVASGTGSGKTECFLLPAIDWILRHPTAVEGVGVRVLLVYPMNALVNDQIRRLRELVGYHSSKGETPIPVRFGRYTGETRRTESQARRHEPDAPDNQVISREAMIDNPPDLLITNFAMLEQTLLRPQESSFYESVDDRAWRFLILDEAHSYRGAQAIELSRLMDRVRAAVRRGKSSRGFNPVDPICIATSATLADASQGQQIQREQTARFAGDLFGSPFQADGVVLADPLHPDADVTPWEFENVAEELECAQALADLPESHLTRFDTAADAAWKKAFESLVPASVYDQSVNLGDASRRSFLYSMFYRNPHFHGLWKALEEGPRALATLGNVISVLDEDQAAPALRNLVTICNAAQKESGSQPLLSCRYHFFASALEGVFCVLESDSERQQHLGDAIRMDDGTAIPDWGIRELAVTRIAPPDRHAFEMAYCSGCHELFVVTEDSLSEGGLDAPPTWMRPVRFFRVDQHESDDSSVRIDLVTGRVADAKSNPDMVRSLQEVPSIASGTDVTQCPECGRKSGGAQVVTRFQTGQDVPVGILTEALYGQLAALSEEDVAELRREHPDRFGPHSDPVCGGGRKLIIFSDSRQNAAYTSSFLQQRHTENLIRQVAYASLADGTSFDMTGWINACMDRIRQSNLQIPYLQDIDLGDPATKPYQESYLPSTDGTGRKRLIRSLLFREVTGTQPHGLEALGLVSTDWGLPELLQVADKLESPMSDSRIKFETTPTLANLLDLVSRILDLMRRSRIIDTSEMEILYQGPAEPWLALQRPEQGADAISSLLNIQATPTNFSDLMDRWLARFGADPAKYRRILAEQVFDLLHGPLCQQGLLKKEVQDGADCVRLNLKRLLIRRSSELTRCSSCGDYASTPATDICTRPRCQGRLHLVPANDHPAQTARPHFYVDRTLDFRDIEMRCEEHTAQLEAELGREVQEAFQAGQINVLSCSTTFEMGIDIGSLQAAVMRNVPPSTANYIQRAGRAGRRSDSVAFVMTFCQRRPHDRLYFREPRLIIAGAMNPPMVDRGNKKILLRHVYAECLSLYWEALSKVDDSFADAGTVGAFFDTQVEDFGETPATHFFQWVADPVRVKQLKQIAIDSFSGVDEATIDETLSVIVDSESDENPLKAVVDFLAEELHALNEGIRHHRSAEQAAIDAGNPHTTKDERNMLQSFERLRTQLRREKLIRFLMNHGVLPSFAFPVNVLRLSVLRNEMEYDRAHSDSGIRFERDGKIAISEYAPGGEVIAGGRIYKSVGLRKFPAQQFDWKHYYRFCDQCGNLELFNDPTVAKEADPVCPQCQNRYAPAWMAPRQFIEPRFGFVTDRTARPKPLMGKRPTHLYSSRAFYVSRDALPPTVMRPNQGPIRIEARHADGRSLLVLNMGGFQRNNQGDVVRQGFEVCPVCGRSDFEGGKGNRTHHCPPYGRSRTCRPGNQPNFQKRVSLGYRYQTDVAVLSIQGAEFGHSDVGFWYSLAYAFLHGTVEALNIERSDLEVTLVPQPAFNRQDIVIYDAVPGGAGHCRHIIESIDGIAEKARDMLSRCDCTPKSTGCYGCLCDYSNQWAHDQLSRGDALTYLERLTDAITQKGEQAWQDGRFDRKQIGDSLSRYGSQVTIVDRGWSDIKEDQDRLDSWCDRIVKISQNSDKELRLVLRSLPKLGDSINESVSYRRLQMLQASGVKLSVTSADLSRGTAFALDSNNQARIVWDWPIGGASSSQSAFRRSRFGYEEKAFTEVIVPDSKLVCLEDASFRHFFFGREYRNELRLDSERYLGKLFACEAGRILIVDPYQFHSELNRAVMIDFLSILRPSQKTNVLVSTEKISKDQKKFENHTLSQWLDEGKKHYAVYLHNKLQQQAIDDAESVAEKRNIELVVDRIDKDVNEDHDRVILWEIFSNGKRRFHRVMLGKGLAGFSLLNTERSEGIEFEITEERFDHDWEMFTGKKPRSHPFQ